MNVNKALIASGLLLIPSDKVYSETYVDNSQKDMREPPVLSEKKMISSSPVPNEFRLEYPYIKEDSLDLGRGDVVHSTLLSKKKKKLQQRKEIFKAQVMRRIPYHNEKAQKIKSVQPKVNKTPSKLSSTVLIHRGRHFDRNYLRYLQGKTRTVS